LYSAKAYGKIIISEVYLPHEQKTIKPVSIGVFAVATCLLACLLAEGARADWTGSLGAQVVLLAAASTLCTMCCSSSPSIPKACTATMMLRLRKWQVWRDVFSSCVRWEREADTFMMHTMTGHELRGLQAYANCAVPGLCLPLMALVDYRGFRLIAISYLPINNKTLVYGSNDGGQTIHARNAKLNRMMRCAAGILNIKEHMCGFYPDRRKLLWSAADIEGHKGTV